MSMLELNPEMAIEQLGVALAEYIERSWSDVLTASRDELAGLFPELEDATYGMYLDKLIPSAWQELERCGFQPAEPSKEDDFVIAGCLQFRNSIEKAEWGTPGHEIRIFWIVLKNHNEKQIGTLVMEFAHSHIQFDIPEQPRIIAFAETERNEIVSRILQRQET
ncbi:DUF6022 family protein [Brevibacillus choshinensis]|uniref:DUF6022 family protein n=2 Tax=Brevibacillus choshinensis TaxID=54911 RepID=UPI002E1E43F7|nr:DUF6022 family protein [Brevibacillus choshinensis]